VKASALAIVLLLPTVWSGLAIDDFFHRLVVEHKLGVPIGRLDVFNAISSNPEQRARFTEIGIYPWWMGVGTQVSYWRPLAALTHALDYTLWPRAAWLMHCENLAWYGALVIACGALYRRLLGSRWVAGLASVLYALDPAHAWPVAWVANRCAIMSTLFGVLTLLGHDQWRSRGKRRYAVFATGAFALALLSAEAGVAIAGYLLAYAVVLERGGIRRRVVSVMPYALVVVAWRIAYRASGHGALASGANFDPVTDRTAFLSHAIQAWPILLSSQVAAVPADVLFERPQWKIAAAVGALALLFAFAYAAYPLLRRSVATRWLGLGALASLVPLGATFPSDRYLFWAGLGVLGIVAQWVGELFGGRAFWTGPGSRTVAFGFAVLRGVASPIAFPLRAAAPGLLEDDYERMIATIPRGPGFAEKTVVVLSAPSDVFMACLPVVAIGKGLPWPAHLYTLYAGADAVTVSRAGAASLVVQSSGGWLSRFEDSLFRAPPQHPGEIARLDAMSATIESVTREGRADRVRFDFPRGVDDSSIVLLLWGAHGFEQVSPPPLAASLTLPPAPLFVTDLLRPHLRYRPTEDAR
jgi:hypothetical protein